MDMHVMNIENVADARNMLVLANVAFDFFYGRPPEKHLEMLMEHDGYADNKIEKITSVELHRHTDYGVQLVISYTFLEENSELSTGKYYIWCVDGMRKGDF